MSPSRHALIASVPPARLDTLVRQGARLAVLTTPPVRPALEQPAAVRELAERAVDEVSDRGGAVGASHVANVRADVRAGE